MQFNLEALRGLHQEKSALLENPTFAAAYKAKETEEVSLLRDVGIIRRAEQLRRGVKQERVMMLATARSHGRRLTKAEQGYLASLDARAAAVVAEAEPLTARQEVVDRLRVRDAIDDSRALRRGFVETAPMEDIISRTVPSLAEGKPLLLFGETGGAKTALARHIAERYLGGDYEFISGHAEVNAYQVMGKTGLRGKEGVTETSFDPGPLYAAMREGRPIILDEIDAMPHSFLIRLNDILQRRPGDSIRIQENANHKITIKEGFCIIATANMRSARYQREELDTAFMQRFRQGAGIEHIRYPDADEQEGTNLPLENYRLAVARLTDGYGRVSLPSGMSTENLINLLKAAHYSQRMFTHAASEVGEEFVDSAQAGLSKPALEKAVLAPREWLGILNQVIATDGEMSLEEALTKFVSSQTVPRDRHILAKLLASHDLLPTASETELRVAPGSLSGFRNAS
jgi:MoxR-like ATPase